LSVSKRQFCYFLCSFDNILLFETLNKFVKIRMNLEVCCLKIRYMIFKKRYCEFRIPSFLINKIFKPIVIVYPKIKIILLKFNFVAKIWVITLHCTLYILNRLILLSHVAVLLVILETLTSVLSIFFSSLSITAQREKERERGRERERERERETA
jgi:hypothetical protein